MPALILFSDTERSPAMRHEVPLAIGDPFLFVEQDGRTAILTSSLDRDRIAAVHPDAELLDFLAFGFRELAQERPRAEAQQIVIARVLNHLGVRDAVVPWDFPVALADALRADGVTVTVDEALFAARRRVKAGAELDGIRAAQAAADAAMAVASDLLRGASPDRAGWLTRPDGERLLAERVRDVLRRACAEHGATCPADMIVASVHNGYGHDPGSGPLPAGLPIEVDLFPRHEATGCWADMTRTFVVGTPTTEHAALIAEQERLVRAALEQTRAAVRPGVTGLELHGAACALFEQAGYATQRTAPSGEREGFQFALGHGVGLEVHEPPGVGLSGREPFIAGDVIAVEPGLWDERIGGVRFEDLLLVTSDGCETLTRFPYELTPS
ncbi:MAG TPA: M24 family metallopeptidase [Solirubrobacteraceae bacterium]